MEAIIDPVPPTPLVDLTDGEMNSCPMEECVGELKRAENIPGLLLLIPTHVHSVSSHL